MQPLIQALRVALFVAYAINTGSTIVPQAIIRSLQEAIKELEK